MFTLLDNSSLTGKTGELFVTPFTSDSGKLSIPYRMRTSSKSTNTFPHNTTSALLDLYVSHFVSTLSNPNQFIEAEFKIPTTIHTIVVGNYNNNWQSSKAELQYEEDDGKSNWKTVVNLFEKKVPDNPNFILVCSVGGIYSKRWRVFSPNGVLILSTLLFFSSPIPKVTFEETKGFTYPISSDSLAFPMARSLDEKTLVLYPLLTNADNVSFKVTVPISQKYTLQMSNTYPLTGQNNNTYEALNEWKK